MPIDLLPTTPRRHITGSLALNIPYVHRHSSGDWHPTVWFDTMPRRLAPHHVTDEAVYGRLLDLLGNSGLRDARRGLATLRHPGGEAPEKVWAATHERAVIELAWDQLQSTVGTGLAPGWPPIDNDDYFRLMRYPTSGCGSAGGRGTCAESSPRKNSQSGRSGGATGGPGRQGPAGSMIAGDPGAEPTRGIGHDEHRRRRRRGGRLPRPGWRAVRQENRYVGAARNTAPRPAKGEWLLFLDDDTCCSPTPSTAGRSRRSTRTTCWRSSLPSGT